MNNSYLNTISESFSRPNSIRVQFRTCRIKIQVFLTFESFLKFNCAVKIKEPSGSRKIRDFPRIFLNLIQKNEDLEKILIPYSHISRNYYLGYGFLVRVQLL